jgi:hypothetical protein
MDWKDIVRGLSPDPRQGAKPVDGADRRPRRSLVLDGVRPEAPPLVLDSSMHERQSIALEAIAATQQWLDDDDLEPGETSADRLLTLVVGIADESQDGEIDDDESEVIDVAREAMWDYLSSLGVDEADLSALLDDWDDAAAERVRDVALANLPDGDFDPSSLVFDDSDQDALFDATYKPKWVIRGGKKMRVKKRISGTIRLSGAQKLALRKARLKANSAGARARRLKSMKLRRRVGL